MYRHLKHYFTTGTAEAEEAFLDRAYVPNENVLDILNPPLSNPRLLVGRKGSGKSIVLRHFRNRLTEAGIPVLFMRPNDFDSSKLPKDTSLGALIRYYKDEFVRGIGILIGREMKRFITTEEEVKLSKLAKNAGARSGDWFEDLVQFIIPLGAGVAKVDFKKLADGIGETDAAGVENAIRATLGKQDRLIYLLFDDTDQVADPKEGHHLNRIWALLLAARQIMEKCPNVRAIISIRTEVWIRICRDDAVQRDQIDHLRDLVFELSPTEEDVEKIALRRFKVAIPNSAAVKEGHEIECFFEGSVTLPGFDESRSWIDFLVKRTRERPRDLIQLVSALVGRADKDKPRPDRIKSQYAADIITHFSTERVQDLQREVQLECPSLEGIIRCFAAIEHDIAGFSMSAEVLKNELMRVPSVVGNIKLHSETIRQMDEGGAFKLWRYLFDIGFLNARVIDPSRSKRYNHRTVRDDPTLISKSRWNELQTMHWDIHPAYRDFLHHVRQTDFMGLPNRGARKREFSR